MLALLRCLIVDMIGYRVFFFSNTASNTTDMPLKQPKILANAKSLNVLSSYEQPSLLMRF